MQQTDRETVLSLPNPQATGVRVIAWLFWGCLVWGVIDAAIGFAYHDAPWMRTGPLGIWLIITGVLAGCLAFALPLGYFPVRANARRVELFRRGFLAGKYLVRWRYPDEAWDAFRALGIPIENKTRRNASIAVACLVGLGVIVFLIVVVVQPGSDPMGRRIVEMITASLVVLMGVGYAVYIAVQNRMRERLATPHDTFISTIGAYANGQWILWGTSSLVLKGIEVKGGAQGQPTSLEFAIDIGQTVVRHNVLVPPGQWQLAERVVRAILDSPESKTGGGMHQIEGALRGLVEILESFR